MKTRSQMEGDSFLARLRQLVADVGTAGLPAWPETRLAELLAEGTRLGARTDDGKVVADTETGLRRIRIRLEADGSVVGLPPPVPTGAEMSTWKQVMEAMLPDEQPRFLTYLTTPDSRPDPWEIKVSQPDAPYRYWRCRLEPGSEAAERELVLQDITEIRRNTLLMEIQHEITIAVNSAGTIDELAGKMIQIGLRLDGIDRGVVFYRDRDSGKFMISAHLGCQAEAIKYYGGSGQDLAFFLEVLGIHEVPRYFDYADVKAMEARGYPNYGKLRTLALIPMVLGGRLEGVLGLASGVFTQIPLFIRNIIELMGADITAVAGRLLAEQALRQSEENYRLLVENQSDLIAKIGMDGRILFASKSCCDFLRVDPLAVVGRRILAFFPRRDWVGVMRRMNELRNPPYRLEFEQRWDADGKERWLSWQCHAIGTPEQGKFTTYLVIGRNVTEAKKAENLLRQSERRLRLILRAVSDCSWDWNLVSDELMIDPNMYKLLGYSPEEIKITIFDIIRNFVHVEDRRRVEHDVRELIDGLAETCDSSFRLQCRDGHYIWVLLRAIVVKDVGNRPIRMVGCIEDITDRRDYDRMKEHYTFLQKMLDALPLPVFFKDLTGKYLGANKAMCRGFEIFQNDFALGKSAHELWAEGRAALADKIDFEERKLLKEGGHSSYVLQVSEDDGFDRELVVHKSLVLADSGTPECIVGAIIDVTDLKKTENALKVASQRLNTILNVMHEIIIWFDHDMRVVWANRAAYETLGGIAGHDITGMRCRDIWFPPGTGENGRGDFVIGRGGGKEVFRLTDGRFFETCFYPVNPTEKDDGWVQLALDVSEQEKARDEAKLKQEQLIQADKMTSLGILVSGVAHEINNPNNFIVINVSILKKAWDNILKLLNEYAGERGEFTVSGVPYSKFSSMVGDLLAGIDEGAERIRVIVNDLKDYVRQTPTDLKGSFNVNDALSRAFTLCRNMIKRATGNYKIVYGNDLPPVKGDVYRIEQVIINIVQNACHALKSRESAITVSTSCSDGREVVIEVADEGIGISPENLKHITDPFFTTKRDIGGTGLGLAISSSIVEEHNGRLQIESTLGEGTTVRVYLPVATETGGMAEKQPSVGTTALNSKRTE